MRFYLEKRVVVGFLVALAILSGLGYYAYLNNEDFARTSRMIAHTNEVLYHLEQSQSAAFELESLLLKYVISGDTSFTTQYNAKLALGATHVKRVSELTPYNVELQKLLDSLRIVGRKKVLYNRKVIEAAKQSRESAQKLIPSEQNGAIQARLGEIIDNMKANEKLLLSARIEENKKGQNRFYFAFTSLLLATVIILVLVFVKINRGLTARIQAEQKTKQLNSELEAFTYSVSHDLRAPLRSIDGYARVLYEDYGAKLDEEGHRTISVIINNAKKMGKLIDDLLEFSRVGRKELVKSQLNMRQLVDDGLHEFNELHSAVVTIHDLPSARGDQGMVRQVWVNLLSNAIKYSHKSEQPQIEVGSFTKDHGVVFFVKDNGVGFDMQYAHKLFGVFQRLHKAKDFEGTGVGLALVYRIVQKHSGEVWAEAELNKGATFYFSLPT